ncbi:hypothetical protein OIU78_002042 [Salix suchowensis]|nr:hypothetical protein OIU78_002042 [Salix suchowensis]
MESVDSNSSPSSSSSPDSHDRHGHRLHLRLKPSRQVAERISRAIRQPSSPSPSIRSQLLYPGRNLRICQLNRLLGTRTLPEALAGACARERFHQLFFQRRYGVLRPRVEAEDGTTCPICLEEMEKAEKVVACGSCRNTVHEECLMRWKRSKGRRAASCVICRARWRDRNDEDKYLNLAAYVGEDDTAGDGVGICAG